MLFIDIQRLGDEIANLTLAEAQELSRYIDECEGLGPSGVLVEVGAGSDESGAEAECSQH